MNFLNCDRKYRKYFKYHLILLCCWLLLGAWLRFYRIEIKPPWADEWATMVFSLGNSFLTIPLETVISLDNLLEPLKLRELVTFQDVIKNLLTESNHPPVYFVLDFFWLKLFSAPNSLASFGVARSLSALFGLASIPVIFFVSYSITKSLVCAQIASALMAVSPYGIYLSQEARHYTLAIIVILVSIFCLITTKKYIQRQQKIPLAIITLWIVVNSLGVAIHYFVVLALVAEVFVLLNWLLEDIRNGFVRDIKYKSWYRVAVAILGTLAGCSVWVWVWWQMPASQLTEWTRHGNPWGSDFFAPWGRAIAWLITMLMLLPIEGVPMWIIAISVSIVLFVLIWLLKDSWQFIQLIPSDSLIKNTILPYLVFAILLIFAFVYIGDRDLTLAARFQFFYFPVLLIFVSAILGYYWQNNNIKITICLLLIAFCGSLSVVNNYAYQKPDRSDLVVPVVREAQIKNPNVPVLMAIVHKTHEQTGEMISIAWDWLRLIEKKATPPLFLLLHKDPNLPEINVTNSFHQQINKLSRPLDIWVVNFSAPTGLEEQNCVADLAYKRRVAGYRYRLYHCK